MIQLLGQGTLYQINRNRQRWLTELERRRAYRYMIAIFTVIAIGVIAWTLRP